MSSPLLVLVPPVIEVFAPTPFVQPVLVWTNLGPQLVVATAPGLPASPFTDRVTLGLTSGRRAPFNALEEMKQTVAVRVSQHGASAQTELHGVEIDAPEQPAKATGSE